MSEKAERQPLDARAHMGDGDSAAREADADYGKAPDPNPPTWAQAFVHFMENLHTGLSGRDGHTGAFHDCTHPHCRNLQEHLINRERRDAFLTSEVQKNGPLARDLMAARAALQRIVDWDDCGCEDHTSEDCCAARPDNEFMCPACVAARALGSLP